jgi:rubrerythrin
MSVDDRRRRELYAAVAEVLNALTLWHCAACPFSFLWSQSKPTCPKCKRPMQLRRGAKR